MNDTSQEVGSSSYLTPVACITRGFGTGRSIVRRDKLDTPPCAQRMGKSASVVSLRLFAFPRARGIRIMNEMNRKDGRRG